MQTAIQGILVPVAALFVLAATPVGQQVFVVAPAPGPGVFSTEIQPAVDAAAEGDIVVVHDGAYASGVTITGKSLTLVAAVENALPVVSGQLRVQGLSASQRCAIRGITFDVSAAEGPALHASTNSGSVWIEDCTFYGGASNVFTGFQDAAVHIESSESIVLVRSQLTGVDQACQVCLGGLGLIAEDSTVFLFEVDCAGGDAWGGNQIVGLSGMAGASIVDGSLFAAGSTFLGGHGGSANPLDQCPGCTAFGGGGGAGLKATGGFTALDCQFVGGRGAPGSPPEYSAGDGPPYLAEDATILAGSARGYSLSFPAQEGHLVTAVFEGIPGELVGILYGPTPSPGLLHPVLGGALWIEPSAISLAVVGVIRPSGTLSASFRAPILPPATQGIAIPSQSIHFGSALAIGALGPPSLVVVLDASLQGLSSP